MSINYNPCTECINNLRHKLFEIKSIHGMQSYDSLKDFLKLNVYDLYLDAPINKTTYNKFNIEHVVPATVFSINRADSRRVEIDKEPFHDPHILFPTLKSVNTLRSNYIFGDVTSDEASVCVNKTKIITIDDTKPIMAEFGVTVELSDKTKFDDVVNKNMICVNDGASVKQLGRDKKEFDLCEVGECVFSPIEETRGAIARCIFYFCLMYAYDPIMRPYTNTGNWLGNIRRGKKKCIAMRKWNEFFYERLEDYYSWGKNVSNIR